MTDLVTVTAQAAARRASPRRRPRAPHPLTSPSPTRARTSRRAGRGTSVTARRRPRQNPSHTYAAPGTYAVSLTATNAAAPTPACAPTSSTRAAPVTVTAAADTYVRSDPADLQLRHPDHDPGPQVRNGSKAVTLPAVRPLHRAGAAGPRRPARRSACSSPTRAPRPARSSRRQHDVARDRRPTGTTARPPPARQIAASKAAPLGQWVEFDVLALVDRGRRVQLHAHQRRAPTRWRSRAARAPTRRSSSSPSRGGRSRRRCRTRRTSASGSTTSSRPRRSRARRPRHAARAARPTSRSDNALWLIDGTEGLYEIDATTNAAAPGDPDRPTSPTRRRSAAARRPAATRSDSLASLTYDPTTDTLYAFSRQLLHRDGPSTRACSG